jgi:site-specific DNA-methyltransferase (adenine-specific)
MIEDVLAGQSRWSVEEGDCQNIIPRLPAHSIDCVVTSPPYAMQRKKQYGGIPEAEYPAWTVAWMDGLKNALKPKGSVLINIREHRNPDGMSDYVHRTRLAVRAAGWREVDELIWIKPNGTPTGPNTLPRRSWERVLWFAFDSLPYCNPLDKGRLSIKVDLCRGRDLAGFNRGSRKTPQHPRHPNYISYPVGLGREGHPAVFPTALADWMLALVCPPGGVALDPFSGSGTTGVASLRSGFFYVGIEKEPSYVSLSRERLHAEEQKARQLEFAA